MTLSGFVAVFLLTAVALSGAAVVAWRHVNSPAADLFAAASAIAGLGSLSLAVGFLTESLLLVLATAIAVGLVFPVPWVLFSFEYVGRERLASARVGTALSVPVVVALLATALLFGERVVPGLGIGVRAKTSGLAAASLTALQLSQLGGLLYAGGLVLVGAGLVLWAFQRYRHLDSSTGIALCAFGVVPWLALVFGLRLEPISFLASAAVMAVGHLFSATAAVALVGWPGLFERVPAAGNIGPATIVDELDEPVVVTDPDGVVVEMNAAARSQLGGESRLTGRSVNRSVGGSLSGLREQRAIDIESDSGRVLFEPTVSDLTDQHGHVLGHAVVLRDITDRRTRQQRLEVLNRILRHNLRNDLSVILGYADVVRTNVDDPAALDGIERITETGEELADISEKARRSTQLLQIGPVHSEPTRIEPLVRDLIERLSAEFDAEFSYNGPDGAAVPVPPEQIRAVFRSLLERALDNNDRDRIAVEVRASYDPEANYPLTVALSDNGTGVPDAERDVIETGAETPLEHTSGVELWTARWVTTSFGGRITFVDSASLGDIEISFPQAELL